MGKRFGFKSYFFDAFLSRWIGMLIRNTLAVLDFNHNVARKSKTGKDGETLFKMKVI